MQLTERLFALHQLDALAGLNSSAGELDFQQSIVHLHTLAGMLLSRNSKRSLAKVLATGEYAGILLPYLHQLTDGDTSETAPLKIACFGYVSDMITATVKLEGHLPFLERYADEIGQIIDKECAREGGPLEDNCSLVELTPWLSLARKPENFTYDNIAHLVDVVKDQSENIEKFPGELFTVLRILKSLSIPQYSAINISSVDNKSEDVIEELKYKYAVVQLFYADLTTHLNHLLTKICSIYPQPGLHVSAYSGSEGSYIISLLEPSLSLLYCLLQQVIQARGSAYHDLNSVGPLLSAYLLVTSFPAMREANFLQGKILQTLLLFTLPGQQKETACNSSSLWSQMISQVRDGFYILYALILLFYLLYALILIILFYLFYFICINLYLFIFIIFIYLFYFICINLFHRMFEVMTRELFL